MTFSGIPNLIGNWLTSITESPVVFLLIMMVILLVIVSRWTPPRQC